MPTAAEKSPRRFPPGPRGLPLVGVVPLFRSDPAGFLAGLARDYGDIVHFRLMRRHAFLFNHPDLVREVLVTQQANFVKSRILQRSKLLLGEGLLTSEGDHHFRQRRLAQPAFHRDRLREYGSIMVDYAARGCSRWSAGQTLDMQAEMMRLTLAIVTRALFSADAEGDAAAVGRAMTEIIDLFRFMMPRFPSIWTASLCPTADVSIAPKRWWSRRSFASFATGGRRAVTMAIWWRPCSPCAMRTAAP